MMRYLILILLLLAPHVTGCVVRAEAQIIIRRAEAPSAGLLGDEVAGLASGAWLRQLFLTTTTNTELSTDVGRYSFTPSIYLDDDAVGERIISLSDHAGLSDSVSTKASANRPLLDTTATGLHVFVNDDDNRGLLYDGRDLARKIWFKADSLGQDSLTIFIGVYMDRVQVASPNGGGQILTTQRHPDTRLHTELFAQQGGDVTQWGNPCWNVKKSSGAVHRLAACPTSLAYDSRIAAPDSAWMIYEIAHDSSTAISLYRDGLWVDSLGTPGRLDNSDLHLGRSLHACNTGQSDDALRGRCTLPLVYDRVLSDAERSQVRDSLAAMLGIALRDTSAASGDEFTVAHITDTQWYASTEHRANRIDSVMAWLQREGSAWNIKLITWSGDVLDDPGTVPAEKDTAGVWLDSLYSAQMGIPSIVTMGNHDYDAGSGTTSRSDTVMTRLLPAANYTGSAWWPAPTTRRGFYRSNHLRGTFMIVPTVSGDSLLAIGIEHEADADVLAWADSVMDAHASLRTVFVTHSAISEGGTLSGSVEIAYDGTPQSASAIHATVNANANLWLGLSGHHARGTAMRLKAVTDESGIWSFFDPMLCGGAIDCLKVHDGTETGYADAGYIRLYVFSPSNRRLRVLTYSPFHDRFLFTHYDHVTISLD